MKLHSPEFERTLRHKCRAAVSAEEALQRKARQHRRRRHFNIEAWFVRLFGVTAVACALAAAKSHNYPAEFLMALCALWFTGAAALHGAQIIQRLDSPPDVYLVHHLPLSSQMVFDWEWSQAKRLSYTILAEALLFGVIIAYGRIGGWQWLAVPVGALVQWQVARSLAVLLARSGRMVTLLTIGGGLMFAVCGACIWGQNLSPKVLQWAREELPVVLDALPSGWVWLLQEQVVNAVPLRWIALLPVAGVMLSGRGCREVMAEARRDVHVPLDYNPNIYAVDDELLEQWLETERPDASVAGNTDALTAGDFLNRPDPGWKTFGILERWTNKLLTDRERLLAEVFLVSPQAWSLHWVASSKWLAGMGIVAAMLSRFFAVPPYLFLALLWGVFFNAIYGRNASLAFLRKIPTSGMIVPRHALLPVGFWELTRLYFKQFIVRWAALLPVVCITAILAGAFAGSEGSGSPLRQGGTYGLYAAAGMGFLLAIWPTVYGLSMAGTTSLPIKWNRHNTTLILLGAVVMLGFMAIGIALMSKPTVLITLGGIGLAACLSMIFLGACGWCYNANRCDLDQRPPVEG